MITASEFEGIGRTPEAGILDLVGLGLRARFLGSWWRWPAGTVVELTGFYNMRPGRGEPSIPAVSFWDEEGHPVEGPASILELTGELCSVDYTRAGVKNRAAVLEKHAQKEKLTARNVAAAAELSRAYQAAVLAGKSPAEAGQAAADAYHKYLASNH